MTKVRTANTKDSRPDSKEMANEGRESKVDAQPRHEYARIQRQGNRTR